MCVNAHTVHTRAHVHTHTSFPSPSNFWPYLLVPGSESQQVADIQGFCSPLLQFLKEREETVNPKQLEVGLDTSYS